VKTTSQKNTRKGFIEKIVLGVVFDQVPKIFITK